MTEGGETSGRMQPHGGLEVSDTLGSPTQIGRKQGEGTEYGPTRQGLLDGGGQGAGGGVRAIFWIREVFCGTPRRW